jgi:DNA-binding HxlR family transcriptional regulator
VVDADHPRAAERPEALRRAADRHGDRQPEDLTERLRILEHQGILTRTVYAEVPPRVVYELTERGESFRSVLEAMAAWGDADSANSPTPPPPREKTDG